MFVLLFGGWLAAQEPNNINPQDMSVWTIDFPVPVDRSKRAWGEIPYCPNSEEDGMVVADTNKWPDGCALRWRKAQSCFECL
jgi:hypothetical protein